MSTTSLVLEFTDTDASEIFETFFASYQEAFVLPDEMEDRGGFAECLRFNHGQTQRDYLERFGPFADVVVSPVTAKGARSWAARISLPCLTLVTAEPKL